MEPYKRKGTPSLLVQKSCLFFPTPCDVPPQWLGHLRSELSWLFEGLPFSKTLQNMALDKNETFTFPIKGH